MMGAGKSTVGRYLAKALNYQFLDTDQLIEKKENRTIEAIFKDINLNDSQKKTILFSPSAASFDTFKNFEDRGAYFTGLIKKYTPNI